MITVRLLRDARIKHHAGEIVAVSPEEAQFLISVSSAEAVGAAKPEPVKEKKQPVKKTTAKK